MAFLNVNNQDQEQKYTVFTWNTQGDFTNGNKSQVIQKFFQKGNNSIVCIQEGGVEKKGLFGNWQIYDGDTCGAKNQRCTNYILAHKDLKAFPQYIKQLNGGVVIGGGNAGRAALGLGIGKTLFVSWHSISANNNEDTATLVKAFDQNSKYKESYTTIIIAGDFNESPNEIGDLVNRNLKKGIWNYQIVNSGQKTQKKGGELDFFVMLSQKKYQYKCLGVQNVQPSDHDPLLMEIVC